MRIAGTAAKLAVFSPDVKPLPTAIHENMDTWQPVDESGAAVERKIVAVVAPTSRLPYCF